MGPKIAGLPEQVGTKEHGTMLKRIRTLEDGRFPAKEAKGWKIEGKKRRITRKEHKGLRNNFELEGFMAKKRVWESCEKNEVQEKSAMPKEEGDAVREYNAMHEESFLSSWLRKDLIGKERKVNERAGEEEENKRRREEGKKRDAEKEVKGTVKRRCVSSDLAEAFYIIGQGEDLEGHGGVSWG